MSGTEWMWPESWDLDRKINFLQEALSYGEKHELYEECSKVVKALDYLKEQK